MIKLFNKYFTFDQLKLMTDPKAHDLCEKGIVISETSSTGKPEIGLYDFEVSTNYITGELAVEEIVFTDVFKDRSFSITHGNAEKFKSGETTIPVEMDGEYHQILNVKTFLSVCEQNDEFTYAELKEIYEEVQAALINSINISPEELLDYIKLYINQMKGRSM